MTTDLRRTAEQLVREASNLEETHRNLFWNISDRMQKGVKRNPAAGTDLHNDALYRDELFAKSSAAWKRAGAALDALRVVDPKGAAEVQAMAARLSVIKREGL